MKLVIAATPKVAIPTISELKKLHQVTIVTQPDRPAGRGKQLRQSEIADAFEGVLKPESEAELTEILQGADLLVTIGYGKILKSETLSLPKFGGINLHFSLLPKWRGAAPVQRAIEAGDKVSGVTVFQMDSGMDTGPIWVQREFPIPYGFSSPELFEELANLGVSAILDALSAIESGGKPHDQSGAATIAKKISKDECVINWNLDTGSIIRKVKAFAFNPGVTTSIRGQQMKIADVREGVSKLQPGELSKTGEVGTADGSVQLLTVIPAGKRAMSAPDWLNGFKPEAGERFE